MSCKNEPALLHIHGQHRPHAEAWIVGNRDGLLALRAAVDAALDSGEGEAEVMVADGEAYDVVVIREVGAWDTPAWHRAAVPYVAEYAREKRADAIWPWNRASDPHAGLA